MRSIKLRYAAYAVGFVGLLFAGTSLAADKADVPQDVTALSIMAAAMLYVGRSLYELLLQHRPSELPVHSTSDLAGHMRREEHILERQLELSTEHTAMLKEMLIRLEAQTMQLESIARCQQEETTMLGRLTAVLDRFDRRGGV